MNCITYTVPLADLCQATISSVYVLVVVILNVLSDAYLISIPLPVGTNTIPAQRDQVSNHHCGSYYGK